jgi:spore germination protein (amino acid permease)
MQLFPEKNLFGIVLSLFGKYFGKILVALFTWYCIHLAALVIRNFSEFIAIVTMPDTPELALMMMMIFISLYMAKSGVKTLGKWSVIALPIVILIMLLTILMLLNQMDFTNLQPVLDHSSKEIATGSFRLLTFPFAESVLFLAVADRIKRTESPYKIYLCGLVWGAAILLIVILRNTMALGPAMLKAAYFPSYVAARIIDVSDFLVRIEGSISINFVLTGITKISLCLIAASKGIACLFDIDDYKTMIFPAGLLSLSLCSILYRDAMEMFDFLNIYSIYAIPFQLVFPALIWIAGEIRERSGGGGSTAAVSSG